MTALNKVYQTCIASMNDLKDQLNTEFAKVDHSVVIAEAIHY